MVRFLGHLAVAAFVALVGALLQGCGALGIANEQVSTFVGLTCKLAVDKIIEAHEDAFIDTAQKKCHTYSQATENSRKTNTLCLDRVGKVMDAESEVKKVNWTGRCEHTILNATHQQVGSDLREAVENFIQKSNFTAELVPSWTAALDKEIDALKQEDSSASPTLLMDSSIRVPQLMSRSRVFFPAAFCVVTVAIAAGLVALRFWGYGRNADGLVRFEDMEAVPE